MQALLASTFRAVGNRVNGRATENLTRSLSCSTFQPLPTPSSHPNVLIVRKRDDEKVERAFHVILRHLRERYPNATLLQSSTEGPLHPRCERLTDGSPINLVITLGGDGTILRASSLFREGPVPPVLSFSLGTLGFLLPFHIDSYQKAIAHAFSGHATVLPRMRLACRLIDSNGSPRQACSPLGFQLMNEVTLHRGRSPHLAMIDAYIDGQHLTECQSDGLIVSTPTGSTAYSLSSGGPIVHPSMKALLLTPICPRSLSFRPLLLPGTSRVELRISKKSRAPIEVSMDGQDVRLLHPDESVIVEASAYPIPCINRPSATRQPMSPLQASLDEDHSPKSDGWVRDINRLLHFNTSFKSSALETDQK